MKKEQDQNPYQDIVVRQSAIFDDKSGLSDINVRIKSQSTTQGTQFRTDEITKRYNVNIFSQQQYIKPSLQEMKQRMADKIEQRQSLDTFFATKKNSVRDWHSLNQSSAQPQNSADQRYKSIEASKMQDQTFFENKTENQTGRDSLFFETS